MPPRRRQVRTAVAAAESRRLLRERTGRSHALLAGRGAAALWAALTALGAEGRPVLIPANTCYIVLWAVLQSGGQPVLVDIDPLTANVSPDTLDRCGVSAPAVIIPAHMYGLPAPMDSICAWAKQHHACVIEDAALALGTVADDRPAGAWGDVSIFSFGAGKIADADGGGALVTDDPALAAEIEYLLNTLPEWDERLERLNRQWLEIYWPLHQYEAATPRLAELYPTLFSLYSSITRCRPANPTLPSLNRALAGLDANLQHRRAIAQIYDSALGHEPLVRFTRPDDAALWRYPLRVPAALRDDLLQYLWSESIDVTRWYPSLQPMTHALAPDVPQPATPHADALAAEIINLPLSPDTTPTEAERAADTIRKFLEIR